MSESKHTPGPWTYQEGTSPHFHGTVYTEETGDSVAVTYNDEDGANARLIAAAPELLEVLEFLNAGMECYCDSTPAVLDGHDKCAVCMAKEAIAKATGA